MATTTFEPPPTTKAALPLAPPCTTLTTAPLQGHLGEQLLSAAVPAARELLRVEEPPAPLAPSPHLGAPRPATTPDHLLDCPISATLSLTPLLVEARASSPQPTPPREPATSPETAASWTPLLSWPTTTTDTPRTTRPTAWVLPHPAWPRWRPDRPTRCMGWDPELGALVWESVLEAQLPRAQKLD